MTTDSTLIADLVRAGVGADLISRVATALANVRDSPGHVRDIVRAYESGRKQKQRENARKSGGKQTMSAAISASEKTENVRDIGERACDVSSFLSSSTEVQRRKRETTSRRGTRLEQGICIPDAYREFARSEGFSDQQIDRIWAEFVDFWIAVPGQRGIKLNWLATWRNRVRAVKERHGKGNGTANPTMGAFDKLVADTAGDEGEANPPMRDITP